MKNSIKTIIIDRGHGTLDDNGVYVTPGKQFKFDDTLTVYEGVENRKYCEAIALEAAKQGLHIVYTIPPFAPSDPSLQERVRFANRIANKESCVFLSVHNNAGKGKGTEVFTSKGQTKSDIVAENIIKAIKAELPDRLIRSDNTDKDLDKEADFYVLKHTIMPAVLMEYGFFDNKEDYEFLSNKNNIQKFAKATIAGILNTKF